jgi:hypothetical protein
MSYVSYSGFQFANKATMVTQIIANLVAAGWQEADTDMATYKVYKSSGESGTRIPEYVRIVTTTTNYVLFYLYYFWNGVTHAGLGAPYTSYQYCQLQCGESSTNTLWMMASSDLVFMGVQNSTSYYSCFFGHAPTRAWTTIGRLTAPASSGSNVVLSLDNVTGTFLNSKQYSFVGASGEGRYLVTLASDGGGTTSIKVATLSTSMSTGSLIGIKPSMFVGYPSSSANYAPVTCVFADNGTATATDVGAVGQSHSNLDSAGSGAFYDHQGPTSYFASPVSFLRTGNGTACANALNTGLWGYSDNHLLVGPWVSYTASDVFSIGDTVTSGTATGTQTISTLKDTSQNWATDMTGEALILTGGTGIGQVRRIASNTTDTITLTQDWVTTPVAASTTYAVAAAAYRVFQCQWGASAYGWFMQEALS